MYICAAMHLYVHIPFCDGKCAYCGFYSVFYTKEKGDAFIAALGRELQGIAERCSSLKTVYFGGGTPTVLCDEQLSQAASLIADKFDLADDIEWTVECSPNTFSESKVQILRDAGASRISVGIQTFCDEVLEDMGRRHTAEESLSVIQRIVKDFGMKAGCDLIAGLPGLSRAAWWEDVKTICRAGLTHASIYALSIEEGTRLYHEFESDRARFLGEDEIIDRLEEGESILREAGIERYEVSNYSAPGDECAHNLAYWRGADYFGAGPGASSRLGRVRRVNTPDVEAYLQASDVPHDAEKVSREEDLQERLIYHFRLREGVDFDAFCEERGVAGKMKGKWESQLRMLVSEGLLIEKGARYETTPRGMDLADSVAESLLE